MASVAWPNQTPEITGRETRATGADLSGAHTQTPRGGAHGAPSRGAAAHELSQKEGGPEIRAAFFETRS